MPETWTVHDRIKVNDKTTDNSRRFFGHVGTIWSFAGPMVWVRFDSDETGRAWPVPRGDMHKVYVNNEGRSSEADQRSIGQRIADRQKAKRKDGR